MKSPNTSSRQSYLRLLSYVKPYWKVLAVSVFLLAILAATEPLFPALMKPLLDEGFTNKNQSIITWLPIILVGLFLLRGILTFTSSYASAWVANKVVTDLRQALYENMVRLPSSFFDQHSSAKLSSHIAYDANGVTGAATSALTILTRDSLTIIGLMAWLLWLDWKLSLTTVALFPLMAITVKYFNKRLRQISSEAHHSMALITHRIEESASNNRTVKTFNAQEFESSRFRSVNETQRSLGMKATVAASAVTPLVQLLASLSVALVIGIALNSSSSAASTAGGFVSFLTALLMLLPPIKRLTDITSVLQRGLAAAEIVFSLLDEDKERETESTDNPTNPSIIGDIKFKNVSFIYENKALPAIKNVSLSFMEGQKTAIVGRSGSGKTTITNLLCRLILPSSGEIFFNSMPAKSIPLHIIRDHISLVSQDVRLFNESVLFNVAYGEALPDINKAQQALKSAYAFDFVQQLPNGIHSQIGQNGISLSGGQRQRIVIARAFYKNAPLLILDEATSALDSESEKYIQKALEKLMHDKTTIVIAHRLSTIEGSDKIIVMDSGTVVETGTHQQLMKTQGIYSHLHMLQIRA